MVPWSHYACTLQLGSCDGSCQLKRERMRGVFLGCVFFFLSLLLCFFPQIPEIHERNPRLNGGFCDRLSREAQEVTEMETSGC